MYYSANLLLLLLLPPTLKYLCFNLLYVAFPELGLLLKQLAHSIVLSPCLLGVYQSMMAYTSFL